MTLISSTTIGKHIRFSPRDFINVVEWDHLAEEDKKCFDESVSVSNMLALHFSKGEFSFELLTENIKWLII